VTERPLPPPEGPAVPLPPPPGPAPYLPPPAGLPVHDLPPPPDVARTGDWRQLNPKMLLVYPVRTLVALAVPMLIAFFGVGQGNPEMALRFAGVLAGLAVLGGLIPWFTTRYRFTDTQLQVRRGLLNRSVVTAPLDRVRSVDLESTVLHRVLGLAKVKVGTGVDETRIELDALSGDEGVELQRYLLRRSEVVQAPAEPEAEGEVAGGAAPAPGEQVLTEIDWSWLRFAPFSLSSLAIVAAILGVGSQLFDEIKIETEQVQEAWGWVLAQSLVILVGAVALVVLVGWVILSTLNYVVQWWNLRLVRQPGGTLKVTRGLFTTRSTTVEEARVRGVRMVEPLLLRLVRGAELATLATGVGTGGTTKVLPPSPRAVNQSVGATVLGEQEPLTVTLREHGPASRRRQLVQAQWTTVTLMVPVLVLTWWLELAWWIPVLALVVLATFSWFLGRETYRNLGHDLTAQYLVAGSGTTQRERTALERAGIIGWVVRQSFFQRRRGLATLVATTAAGPEHVEVADLPLEVAVALADAATPELLGQFAGAPAPTGQARAGWGDWDL
jgi:putative membrane protein